jgi:hypothetical protein
MSEVLELAPLPIPNESPVEPIIDQPNEPQPVSDGRFTPANARLFSARGVAARRAKALQPEPEEPAPEPKPIEPDAKADYVAIQIVRVRALLDANDALLAKTKDPQDRERLARASHVLAERWRILSGIPLPGALRPSGKVSRSAAGNVEPV